MQVQEVPMSTYKTINISAFMIGFYDTFVIESYNTERIGYGQYDCRERSTETEYSVLPFFAGRCSGG